MKDKSAAAWSIIWIISLCSFYCVFLTGDFQCFISWARQVSESGISGISALSSTWELKGALSRLWYFLLYQTTSLSGLSDISLQFQFLYKFLGIIILNGILALSIAVLPKNLIADKITKIKLFFVVSSLLMCVHFASHLQPEFIAVYFLILSLCLYLKQGLIYKTLAGVILGLTFFLKSPIPIMGGSLFCLAMLIKKTKFTKEFVSILPLGISMLFTIAAILFYLKVYSPQEIQDIIDASTFQHTLFSSNVGILSAIKNGILNLCLNIWYSPIVGLGICVTLIFLSKLRTEGLSFILTFCAFAFPFFYVVISNCFFVYHYYLFAFPAIVCVVYYWNSTSLSLKKRDAVCISFAVLLALATNCWSYLLPLGPKVLICITLFLFGLFIFWGNKGVSRMSLICSLLFVYLTNSSAVSASTIRAEKEYQNVLADTRFDGQRVGSLLSGKDVLFLEGGCAGYLIPNKSYLRYFYPLPIQRIDEESSGFVNTDTFQTIKQQIRNYQGDYIIIDEGWFFRYEHDWARKFISSNYEQIGTVEVCNPNWDLFIKNQMTVLQNNVYIRCQE